MFCRVAVSREQASQIFRNFSGPAAFNGRPVFLGESFLFLIF